MRWVRVTWLMVVMLGGAAAADAQDALRGKRLYLDAARVVGSGVSCVDCHGGLPGGLFGIGRAANDPARVEQAVNTIPQMTPFRGRLAAADFVDLAAYIGNPAVPSPQVTISTTTPTGVAGAADRIEFGNLAAGAASAVATFTLSNTGAVAFTVIAAPVLDGANATEFSLESTTCAVGTVLAATQSCRVDLRFRPQGAAGNRSARVQMTHDWVGGVAAVALLGSVGTVTAPPAAAGGGGGGGAISPWWLLAALLLLPGCARRRA